MFGAERLLAELQASSTRRRAGRARTLHGPCSHAPVADGRPSARRAGHRRGGTRSGRGRRLHPELPEPTSDLAAYRAAGGYELCRACRHGDPPTQAGPAVDLAALDNSGLRGCGGAGFPTGAKWRIVRSQPGAAPVAVNADEGEPGTFKDRYYLRPDPHRLLEGMLIAAHCGRGGRRLLLSARRVSGDPRDPAARDRPARGRGHRTGRPASICVAAPAPISAAKNRRCWRASRASAACRGTARPTWPRSGCSAGRP